MKKNKKQIEKANQNNEPQSIEVVKFRSVDDYYETVTKPNGIVSTIIGYAAIACLVIVMIVLICLFAR